MRLILALLFTVMGGAAWGQACVPPNVTNCPGNVAYKGPVQIGNQTGPAPSPGDINITGSYKVNGVPITSSTTQLTVNGVTSNSNGALGSLPANSYILGGARCHETSGISVNVAIGSTSGASDVAPAFPVFAGTGQSVTSQAFFKAWFSASQALYVSSTSWGGATVNCVVPYQVGP